MATITYKKFKQLIWSHYHNHKRDFAWRTTTNPYHILVSEIMLQQTQTHRVAPKYDLFLHHFPTVQDLSKAPLAQVLSLWQGLGYNRRAQALHQTAKIIVQEHKGLLPQMPDQLIALPGIGSYTSNAVCTFAFNQPNIFIETNIRAVYIHFFFQNKTGIHDKQLLPLIKKTIDKNNPRHWYYALMDYGVFLKKNVANPSRKSVHHSTQSKFEGSDRQIRGAIIRLLTQRVALSYENIILGINKEEQRVHRILYQLYKEQMVVKHNNMFQLPH